MTQVGDPIGSGFVASLARPGGSITGLSTLAPELSGKQLELSKEMAPKLRVAGRWDFDQPGQRAVMLFKITKTQNLPPEERRPSSEAAAIKALGNSGGVKAINVP